MGSNGENINNPNAKASSSNEMKTSSSDNDNLLFFNHHEYLVDKYEPLNSKGPSLVINHFPNIHVSSHSATYCATRIVRIPRVYHTTPSSDIIPQFSLYIPGREPASISLDTEHKFTAVGTYEDHSFGQTSLTPLVPDLITEEEYITIVTTVNSILLDAFDPYKVNNILNSIFDFLTGGVLSMVMDSLHFPTYSKRKLAELDQYLDTDINEGILKHIDGVKFLSPRLSGYLSLDIQIPNP